MSNLDQIAKKILETRSNRAASLTLINEATRQYTIIALPIGWQTSERKPFDLRQEGYVFLSKWQTGICPQEIEDGKAND